MKKLRFDPFTYQFYWRCRREDGELATTAGFRWDAARHRYYTGNPAVAVALSRWGNQDVRQLLADALESAVADQPTAYAA